MQRLVAKAVYDNIAETPDELAFKRGDVIIVLEQDTGGLEGWWLCSLRGKQGIAPGNRLKLVNGMINHARSQTADFSQAGAGQKMDTEWNRRSWDGSSNKVPGRPGEMYLYDQPKAQQQSDYDVPPTRYPGTPSSTHSSRDELDVSGTSLDQSVYDTPPQSRSFRSPDMSLYDTPPSHLDPYDLPSGSARSSLMSKLSDEAMSLCSGMSGGNMSKSNPASMCDSARSSMDISPLDLYDVPPSQREREAKAGLYPVRSSKDSGLDMYDSPPKLKSPPSMLEDYDVPKLASINSERDSQLRNLQIPISEPSSPASCLDDYDVPKSSKTSAVDSDNSGTLTRDSKLDDYDIPKQSSNVVSGKPPIATLPKRHKSNSLGSLLDDYDTPSKSHSANATKDDYFGKSQSEDRVVKKTEFSDDENSYDEPDARPKLKKQEHAVDDLYDSPRNNAPVKNMVKEFSALSITNNPEPLGVYDIPPQVTRDSVISSRSDSSDGDSGGNSRLSVCSVDSRGSDLPLYDELPLDLDAANDLVIKLQQDVQKATNKFHTFVHSSWRKKDNIEQKLYDIKLSCYNLEQALGEFVEFGQGTLANSAKVSDRKLINKLSKYLIPLQQALQQIRISIKHLDDANWQVSKMTASSESPKKDDLGIIVSLAKELNGDVRKLASFIQGNSSLLFKRAKDFNRSSRSNSEHSIVVSPSGKPPISRKPPVPAKQGQTPTLVQTRPLPAPPPTERPLPPTPTRKTASEFTFSSPEEKEHPAEEGKKTSEYKHWSGEFQVKRMSVEREAIYKLEDLTQEYDYVELEDDQMDDEKPKQKRKSNQVEESREKSISPEKGDFETEIDSYEKELDATLDEDIEGVNIYSDDTGTLKRGKSVDEVDSGTLKKDKSLEDLDKEGTLKRGKSLDDLDSGTLKKCDDTLKRGKSKERLDVEAKLQEVIQDMRNEVPEHDIEPVKLMTLDADDRQVLAFYSEQLDTHSTLLSNSVDAFFSCIENNTAPKVFISHSKFVVVSAHKLVYIGDSIHRNLKHSEVRTKIIQSANFLCDCLKLTVTATKTAALQYPSVPAVQEMVNRVRDVSRAAGGLQKLVRQASKL